MDTLKLKADTSNGIQTRAWGPPAWFFLHSIAQNYPVKPDDLKKEQYLAFFISLGNVLPCRFCRESYYKYITGGKYLNTDENEQNDPDPITEDDKANLKLTLSHLESRATLTKWLFNLHNRINDKLKLKYNDPPTFEDVTKYYDQFPILYYYEFSYEGEFSCIEFK